MNLSFKENLEDEKVKRRSDKLSDSTVLRDSMNSTIDGSKKSLPNPNTDKEINAKNNKSWKRKPICKCDHVRATPP